MQKKSIVRPSDQGRSESHDVVKKLKATTQKVKQPQILLKSDADGPGWTDQQIAWAFNCRTQTVEDVQRRLVARDFEETLNGPKRTRMPTPDVLDVRSESLVIALRLSHPPRGFGKWTQRLLARKVGELKIVEWIIHETIRRTLKKQHDEATHRVLGDFSGGRRGIRGRHGRCGRYTGRQKWPDCWRADMLTVRR